MPDLSEGLVEALDGGAGCENHCIKDESVQRNGISATHSGVAVDNIIDIDKACQSRSQPVGIAPPSQDKQNEKTSCWGMPDGNFQSAVSNFENEEHDSVGSGIQNCSPETCEHASAASRQAEPDAAGQVPGEFMLFISLLQHDHVAGQNTTTGTQFAPAHCKTGTCNLVAPSQQQYKCVEQCNLDSLHLPFSNTRQGSSPRQSNIARLSAGPSATVISATAQGGDLPSESQSDSGPLFVTQQGQGRCLSLWQQAPLTNTTRNSRQTSNSIFYSVSQKTFTLFMSSHLIYVIISR